jgi:diamine N-acetyltransferase
MATVLLRAPEPADTDLLYLWENDSEIWKVSNTITPFSRYILEKYIENAHLDLYQVKQLRLMIDVQEESSSVYTVGTIDMFDFDPFHLRAGVGILIGNKSDRNKGYATIALQKFIEYSFGTLQLHQLYCNIARNNQDSLNLFQKCGFRVTGQKADWLKTAKGFTDELILQLINKASSDSEQI